jgi:hypothetical protein
MYACPLQALAQVTSRDPEHPCWQVVRAACTVASHGTFLLAQLPPQEAPFPAGKQAAIAAL